DAELAVGDFGEAGAAQPVQGERDLVAEAVAVGHRVGHRARVKQIVVEQEDRGLETKIVGELLLPTINVVVPARTGAVEYVETHHGIKDGASRVTGSKCTEAEASETKGRHWRVFVGPTSGAEFYL